MMKFSILVLSFLIFISCKESAFHAEKVFAGGIKVSADTLNLGKMVYMENCFACHGIDGGGNGVAAKGLIPPPRNFKQGLYKFGNVLAGGLPHDEHLMTIIKKGLHGSAMLPWDMGEGRLFAVTQYLKTFAPDIWEGGDKELGELVEVTKDPYGVAHKQSAIEEGKAVYHITANCQSCHRSYVDKKEMSQLNMLVNNEPLEDFEANRYELKIQESEYKLHEKSPLLVKQLPPDFTWHPVKSVHSIEDLYLRIAAGIGGTAMPAWKGVLEDDEIWAVTHYIWDLMQMKDDPVRRKALMSKLKD